MLKHRKIEQHYMNEILQDEDAELYYMRSVIEEETRRLIFTAIDSLPEHCRKVCLLNLEGMDTGAASVGVEISGIGRYEICGRGRTFGNFFEHGEIS